MTEEISCATLKILALPVYGSKDVGVLYHESILPIGYEDAIILVFGSDGWGTLTLVILPKLIGGHLLYMAD